MGDIPYKKQDKTPLFIAHSPFILKMDDCIVFKVLVSSVLIYDRPERATLVNAET
jgi:hypothetical protein